LIQEGLSGNHPESAKRSGMFRIVLVRHGVIAQQWKGICYGSHDVPLCERWMSESQPLVQQLAALRPTVIFHSGLNRSQWLAERVRLSIPSKIQADRRLRERNFGDWEGKTWDEVYASDPDNFHGLIDKPNTYRPPGGETTTQLQERVIQWYKETIDQASDYDQTIIAITHSGPIAALAGHVLGLPPTDWSPWLVACGESIVIAGTNRSDWQVTRGL
jgi:broad specificity phosphatase PhoE